MLTVFCHFLRNSTAYRNKGEQYLSVVLKFNQSFHIDCFCGSGPDVSLWHVPISSEMVTLTVCEEFISHRECHMQVDVTQVHRDLHLSCQLEPFGWPWPTPTLITIWSVATAATAVVTTWSTSSVGLMCDRQGEGMGSHKHEPMLLLDQRDEWCHYQVTVLRTYIHGAKHTVSSNSLNSDSETPSFFSAIAGPLRAIDATASPQKSLWQLPYHM